MLEADTLTEALRDVDVAFYMVHSMGAQSDFSAEDRTAAEHFARAAEAAGVRRIIYLGGLGDEDDVDSAHLRSRHEVGRILRASRVETLELRASIIIGSGSLSFEMIRNLVNRLPAMVTPRWVYSLAQPIAIEDVLRYLLEAIDVPLSGSEVVEIGGTDQVAYVDIMKEFAHQRGMRRLIIPLPVLSPKLSSLWLGLVTPSTHAWDASLSIACGTIRSCVLPVRRRSFPFVRWVCAGQLSELWSMKSATLHRRAGRTRCPRP